MSTLLQLRTKLNGEVGVSDDTNDPVWTPAVRNAAITDGYAELWRAGVWKLATQTIATVTDQWIYTLTSIRRLDRLELVDSSARFLETPRAVVEDDGSAGWQLRLNTAIDTGFSMRVRGWTAFKSQFSGDGDTDDLPAEHNRIPLLKAKAILWRIQVGTFARYGERQTIPPEMNLSVDQLLGMISAAEREYETESAKLSKLRPRSGQTRSL